MRDNELRMKYIEEEHELKIGRKCFLLLCFKDRINAQVELLYIKLTSCYSVLLTIRKKIKLNQIPYYQN